MLLADYDKMMEEKGSSKVWVVEQASFSGITHSSLFMSEEAARKKYDSIPDGMFRSIYRTWDIWGFTERQKAKS